MNNSKYFTWKNNSELFSDDRIPEDIGAASPCTLRFQSDPDRFFNKSSELMNGLNRSDGLLRNTLKTFTERQFQEIWSRNFHPPVHSLSSRLSGTPLGHAVLMFSWISFSRRWEFPQILQRVFWRQNRLAWPLEHLYWAFRALNWLQNARLGWYSVWQCIGGWETTRSEAGSLLWTHPSLSLSPFQKRRGVSPWIVRVPIRSPSSSWKGRSACCSISLFTQTLSSDPEDE